MSKTTMLIRGIIALSLGVQPIHALSYYAPPINLFGQLGLVRSHSAHTMGLGRITLGAYGNYALDDNYLTTVRAFNTDSAAWTDTLHGYRPDIAIVTSQLFAGIGVTRFLDFAAAMPVYFENLEGYYNPSGARHFGYVQGGFGDIELSLKFQYPPYPHKRLFKTAYFGAVTIPTGNRANGLFPRHAYYLFDRSSDTLGIGTAEVDSAISLYSSTGPEIDMKMLWTVDLGALAQASPVMISINYGVRWTKRELPHLFLLNLAFDYNPVNWLHLFTEFSSETRISNVDRGFKIGDDPLRLTPGITLTPRGGFFFSLSADISLSSDTTLTYHLVDRKHRYSTGDAMTVQVEPQYRVAASLGWAGYIIPQDADQDGIRDNVDRCPKDPEDLDNFEDSDGCPDLDNDNDGIADLKDKCPNEAEDIDGFEDLDGCPDPDNDRDQIADVVDQCPNAAEDFDGFDDHDGCPDDDNDNDGIPDSVDHCINLAEDRDNFQDQDGCPDMDNDMDGVPDSLDKCPDLPGDPANNGCPRAEEKPRPTEIKRGRVVLRGVNFESGSAQLTGDSYAILERVRDSLREWPEIQVQIIGHTDAIGNGLTNRRLSQARAESVRAFLIAQGIDPGRLVAIGRGEDDPIADNTSAEGRQMNRRVELHRID